MLKLCALIFLFLVGCTGVSSIPVGGDRDRSEGLVYSVPTTVIPITISIDENAKSLTFDASQPQFKRDERHNFRIYSPYSPIHTEKLNIKINEEGLITSTKLVSESRLAEIIAEASKIPIFAENAAGNKSKKIMFKTSIDVGALARNRSELKKFNELINSSIHDYIHYKNKKGNRSFLYGLNGSYLRLDIKKVYSHSAPAGTKLLEKVEDCSHGICFRLPILYSVAAQFFDGTFNEVKFSVPNDSDIYATKVRRGIFSDWTTEFTFINGIPTAYSRDATSEIEAIVQIPSMVVAAQIAALQQRANLFKAQEGALTSERSFQDLLSAESALSSTLLFSLRNGSLEVPKSQIKGPKTGNIGNGAGASSEGGGVKPGSSRPTTPSSDGTG